MTCLLKYSSTVVWRPSFSRMKTSKRGRNCSRVPGSFLLPSDPVSGVFQDDPEGSESISNTVGRREFLALSRILSQPHDEVHHAVEAVGREDRNLEES